MAQGLRAHIDHDTVVADEDRLERRVGQAAQALFAFAQLQLGVLALRDVARHRLKAGHHPVFHHQMHVLVEPDGFAMACDRRIFVMRIGDSAHVLAAIEAARRVAAIGMDQVEVIHTIKLVLGASSSSPTAVGLK